MTVLPGNGIPPHRDRWPKIGSGREKVSAETEPEPQKPAKLRASWPSPGNLAVRKNAWWARQDSNLQPDRYDRSALAVEPRARSRGARRQGPRELSVNADSARQPRRSVIALEGCYLYAVCAQKPFAYAV